MFELLHLCDSLFPIGSFSHSDGLEAATATGDVRSAGDLACWIEACVAEQLGKAEGPAVRRAWQLFVDGRVDAISALDREMHALRAASTSREASRSMGTRLLTTWQRLHPNPALDSLALSPIYNVFTLPVSFGVVSAAARIDLRHAVEGFFYTRLAATISSAMRLMALGQNEAHRILARALDRARPVVDGILTTEHDPSCFSPALDVATMSQQYVHSRLFRS